MANRLTPPRDDSFYDAAATQPPNPLDDPDNMHQWFQCYGINADLVLKRHNRATVPIEEDMIFLHRLRDAIKTSPRSTSDEVLDDFLRNFKDEVDQSNALAAEMRDEFWDEAFDENDSSQLFSFLRSSSTKSANIMVHLTIPSLINQIRKFENLKEEDSCGIENHTTMPEDNKTERSLEIAAAQRSPMTKKTRRSRAPNTSRSSQASSSLTKKIARKGRTRVESNTNLRRSKRLSDLKLTRLEP